MRMQIFLLELIAGSSSPPWLLSSTNASLKIPPPKVSDCTWCSRKRLSSAVTIFKGTPARSIAVLLSMLNVTRLGAVSGAMSVLKRGAGKCIPPSLTSSTLRGYDAAAAPGGPFTTYFALVSLPETSPPSTTWGGWFGGRIALRLLPAPVNQ